MKREIKGIIFDCDGVLVDSEKTSCGVFAEMMREQGADVTNHEVFLAIKGGSIEHSLAYASSKIPSLDQKTFEEAYRIRSYAAFSKEMKPVNGVVNLLQSLKIPKSVVSNGPMTKILMNLESTKIIHHFKRELIFSGHEWKKFKPDPYLFLQAAKNMKVKPENCLVVEDSAHGAQAAQQAGMLCYGYTEMTDPGIFYPYDAIPFSDMDEIRTIIA